MPFDTEPTIESINSMTEHLTEVWQETHANWMVADTFYELTYRLWDQKQNRPTVHPAKAKSIIDTGVAQMMGHDPTFERFPSSVDKKDEADSGEKALKPMYHQMWLLETEDPLETAKKNLLLYGYAVVEDAVDGEDLAFHDSDLPKKDDEGKETETQFKRRMAFFNHRKKTLMPFRNRAPHPADVLMDPSHKNPRIAIKTGKWYAIDLAEITENRFDANGDAIRGTAERYEAGDNPYELIEAVEYWTPKWHALMTRSTKAGSVIDRMLRRKNDAQLLFVEPNTWQFVPFEHAFAGFGHRPTSPNERGPRNLAVGMLDPIMDDLRMDAQRIAGMHNALMEATFAKRWTTEDAAELENQESEGDTIHVTRPGTIGFLEQPQLPGHLQNFGFEVDRDIEGATYLKALGGQRDVGINTLGQAAIQSTSGHRVFIAPTKQVNHLFTKSAEHILQWIDILDLDLTIEGNEINRKIIDGDYAVKVDFKVVDPVLQMQERQLALTEYQSGVMDLETFWSISGQLDATGARERLWDDLLYADPVIQKAFIEQRAKKLGLDKMLAEQPDVVTESASTANATSQILGPDGQPISSGLRQPLTDQILKPPQTGQNLAG